MANGRCVKHGGATPKGTASPHYRHGRYSKSLPSQLANRYQDALNDPEFLNLRAEIALVESLIDETLANLDAGGAFTVFKELRSSWSQLLRLQAAGRTAEADVVLAEVGQLIDAGSASGGAMHDLVTLIDQRRKLAESQQKRLVAMQQLLTVEQAMTFVGVVVAAVKAHVSDPEALSAISKEVERHALQVRNRLDA